MIHFEKKIISLNFASFCETVSRDVNVDQYCNRKQSRQLKNRHKICIGQKEHKVLRLGPVSDVSSTLSDINFH